MITGTERRLLSIILERYQEQLTNASCNEVPHEWRHLMDKQFREEVGKMYDVTAKDVFGYDWMVIGYLQSRIDQEAGATQ